MAGEGKITQSGLGRKCVKNWDESLKLTQSGLGLKCVKEVAVSFFGKNELPKTGLPKTSLAHRNR